jgi:Zn-dependent protease with chaperone function
VLINSVNRQLSTFSVDEESQADRVGLSLMAIAGYDPREAPILWKNIYEVYGKLSPEQEQPTITKKAREELTKDNTKNKTRKKSNSITTAAEFFNILVKWKANDYKSKSFATHPDQLNRFQQLNRFVSLYWNSESVLQNTTTGEDRYKALVKKLGK